MKSNKILIATAFAMLFATSCAEVDTEGAIAEEQSLDVTFETSITTSTRVTANLFDEGDEIFVSASDATTFIPQATNRSYTYNSEALFTASNPIVYTSTDQKLIFSAVYPAVSDFADTFTFSAQSDQSTADGYEMSDLLISYDNEATNDLCPMLNFDHKMTSLIINFVTDDDVSDVVIYAKNGVDIDIVNDTYTASGSAASITPASNGNKSIKVIFAPQSFEQGDAIAEVVYNGTTYTWEVSNSIEFLSEYRYTYEWTITEEGDVTISDISFVGYIQGWDDTVLTDDAPVEEPLVSLTATIVSDYVAEFELSDDSLFSIDSALEASDLFLTYSNSYSSAEYSYSLTTPLTGVIRVDSATVTSEGVLQITTKDKIYNTDEVSLTYLGSDGFVVDKSSQELTSRVEVIKSTPTAVNLMYDFEDASQLDDWEVVTLESTDVITLSSDLFGLTDDPFTTGKCLMLKPSETTLTLPIIRCNNKFDLDVANNKHFAMQFNIARTETSTTATFSTTLLYPPYGLVENAVTVYKDLVWSSEAGASIPSYTSSLYFQYAYVLNSVDADDDRYTGAYTALNAPFYPINNGDTPTAIDSYYEDIMLAISVSSNYTGTIYIDNVVISNAEAR